MKRPWLALTTMVLAGLLTLVWLAPAHWLTQRVGLATAGQLQLVNSEGTVWSGSTQLVVSDGRRQWAVPGRLLWATRLTFDQGRPQLGLTISHPQLAQALTVQAGVAAKSGARIVLTWNTGTMQIPAQWLQAIGAPWNTLKPEGVMVTSWTGGRSDQGFAIDVEWKDAQSALTPVRPLGQYKVHVAVTSSGQGDVTLSTLTGPLMLNGRGQWAPGGQWSFNGYADANTTEKPALIGLLSQMGRREGERFRLSF